jgi:hypothetical protein
LREPTIRRSAAMAGRARRSISTTQTSLLNGDKAALRQPYFVYQADGRAAFERCDFETLEAIYADSFVSKATLPDGRRGYTVIEDLVGAAFDSERTTIEDAEKQLQRIHDTWETTGKGAFASAVCANSFFSIGYMYRGTDVAMAVSDESWQAFNTCIERAHDILIESAPQAAESPIWHRSLFFMGLADGCTAAQRLARFERALAFDPYEVNLYTNRAYQLLPRWHGTSAEIEAFARDAVSYTSPQLGNSIYARIYAHLSDMEHVPDMSADWAQMKAGFEDWFELTKSQYMLNTYASLADQFEDKETAAEIVRYRLREFFVDAWADPEQPAKVFRKYRK